MTNMAVSIDITTPASNVVAKFLIGAGPTISITKPAIMVVRFCIKYCAARLGVADAHTGVKVFAGMKLFLNAFEYDNICIHRHTYA